MPSNNQVSKSSVQFAGPPTTWAAVVLDADIKGCTQLYVGGAGNINAVGQDDVAVVFTAVPVGTTLRGNFKRINSASTTATLMVAMFV